LLIFLLQGLAYRHSCEGPDDMVSRIALSRLINWNYGEQTIGFKIFDMEHTLCM